MAEAIAELRKGARPTVFLERDGVLNQPMPSPIADPHQLLFLPGALRAAARLTHAGYRTVVLCERAEPAEGAMTEAGLEGVDRCLRGAARAAGGNLDEIFACPQAPDGDCRLPQPGLLDAAHAAVPVDWPRSYLVAGSQAAVDAGHARGLRTILLREPGEANYRAGDLVEAVAIILGEHEAVFSRK